MYYPHPGDYIDIHNHDSQPAGDVFIIDNLMAHEGRLPDRESGMNYSMGIHPWFLNEANQNTLMEFVRNNARNDSLIAIGEAGFDKLKGPAVDLQRQVFEQQAALSEELGKPLFIHCVKAWDELIASHKKIKPEMPWLVHGFRGKKELAMQLISRNMYISFWFDFIVRPEASVLVRSLPTDRIFLETDGSGADIREIYKKVSVDIGTSVEELKNQILLNYSNVFIIKNLNTE
jgi:TatD DNase family protein